MNSNPYSRENSRFIDNRSGLRHKKLLPPGLMEAERPLFVKQYVRFDGVARPNLNQRSQKSETSCLFPAFCFIILLLSLTAIATVVCFSLQDQNPLLNEMTQSAYTFLETRFDYQFNQAQVSKHLKLRHFEGIVHLGL